MPDESETNRNLLSAYMPIGSVAIIVIALFTFYTQIQSSLDTKFAAMAKKQEEFRLDVNAGVQILREAIIREHPDAALPRPTREK